MTRAGARAAAPLALLLASACASAGDPAVRALRSDIDRIMEQQVADGFSGTVFVAVGDKIVLQEGYGLADRRSGAPMTPETVIDSGSLSKQVTAAAAVLLASQGRLSLHDTLGDYFPQAPADKRDITIEQLLSHTGGVARWVFPDDFTPIPQDAWLDMVFAAPLEHEPGSAFLYSNDGVTLVAIIIERVTGQPFKDYIEETFFAPLGMAHSGWSDDPAFDDPSLSVATGYFNGKDDGDPSEWPGPSWALLGNGGISWTPSDMFRWSRAVHGDLLPSEAKDELFRPRVTWRTEPFVVRYALAWDVADTACGWTQVGHNGAGVSHNVDYRYYVEPALLVYVASNKIDRDYTGAETMYAEKAADEIAASLMRACPQGL